jgi:O-acetyl-ADP-ribose deacetylase (regulator of RNase III)
MIKFRTGNILQSEAEALVNTVNTVGVMGKGIALAYKNEFPDNYRIYREAYEKGDLKTGKMLLTQTGLPLPRYIINFPTKKHWREKSNIQYIIEGMHDLVRVIQDENIQSIAIPPLGCGNGGLDWNAVKPIIVNMLKPVEDHVEITIFEPGYTSLAKSTKKEVKLTPARAMLLLSLSNYEVLGYSINLLVAQKQAYFLQRLGEPLNLTFDKGFYGPYSHQLQHLVKYLNGHYLSFEHDRTSPGTVIKLKKTGEVSRYAEKHLTKEQSERLHRLQTLTEGFESPYGLELLATIDFIRENKNHPDLHVIENEIGSWTKRKKAIMKPYHIKVAYERIDSFFNSDINVVSP